MQRSTGSKIRPRFLFFLKNSTRNLEFSISQSVTFSSRSLTRCLLSFAAVAITFISAAAADNDAALKSAIKRLYDERGKNWVCYWEIMLPDRMPVSDGLKIVPGLSGLSEIELGNSPYPATAKQSIDILNFADDYTLPLLIPGFGLDEIKLENDIVFVNRLTGNGRRLSQFGDLWKIPSPSNVTLKNASQFSVNSQGWENPTATIIVPEIALYGENGDAFELRLADTEKGYLFLREWNGQGNRQRADKTPNGNLWYISGIRLIFFRVDNVSHASVQKQFGQFDETGASTKYNDNRSYPIVVCNFDTNLADNEGNADIELLNFYGQGIEMTGNVMDYALAESYDLSQSTTRIRLKNDGSAVLTDAIPGMLQITPFECKGAETQFGVTSFNFNINSTSHHYTDFAVVAADQLESLELPPMTAGPSAVEEKFNNLRSTTLNSPAGSWTMTTSDVTVNPHWDSMYGLRKLSSATVSFPEHYLVPVHYRYNVYTFSDKDFRDLGDLRKAYVIKVNSLETKIDCGESIIADNMLDLNISSYGHGTIASPDDQYLFLEGTLNFGEDLAITIGAEVENPTELLADKVRLYLVRGAIDDLSISDLNDHENGCSDALWVNPALYSVSASLKKSELSTNAAPTQNAVGIKISFVVPENDIPTRNLSGDTPNASGVFTVYARYENEGMKRFRPLAILSDNDITTSADLITTDLEANSINSYELNSNVLTAQRDLSIFALDGRLVGQVAAGSSIVLSQGVYIIKVATSSDVAKIIIKR